MKRWCFSHKYKAITPSFMHLFVAKDIGDTPSAVPMFAGRECVKCGKRHAIALQDVIPDLIKERVQSWCQHQLETVVQGEQLLSFASKNKTIFIKDLETFMIASMLEQAGMSGIIIIPGGAAVESEAELEEKKANLHLVVNNNA
jgi:hypothetical protein